jgi:hypothetical protein
VQANSKDISPACRQLMIDNHMWLTRSLEVRWPMPHVHGDILEQVPVGSFDDSACFHVKNAKLKSCHLQAVQYCYTCDDVCPVSGLELSHENAGYVVMQCNISLASNLYWSCSIACTVYFAN